jgi:hypothetical protein
VPGLARTGAVLAAPDPSGRAGLQANLVAYSPPSLLSKNMRAAVRGRVPAPVPVTLGDGVQAFRYDRLRLAGYTGVVTVYAVPTTDWVTTLACYAPPGLARGIEPACATAAASLRPTTSRPESVGPSAAFADSVSRTLATLQSQVAGARRALARADAPGDQAKAADRFADAYREAAGTLSDLPDRVVDGAAVAPLVEATSATSDAYVKLAGAARLKSLPEYERATRGLAATRAQLQQARRTFARGGYETR